MDKSLKHAEGEDQDDFHPLAPPITKMDGSVDAPQDVVKFDSNFIMAKRSETGEVRKVSHDLEVRTYSVLMYVWVIHLRNV